MEYHYGQPTDDSEMVLLLARMLVKTDLYDPEATRKEYWHWPSSDPFDGGMIISAGQRGNPNPDNQTNEAMMWIIGPPGIFGTGFELSQVVERGVKRAALTHPDLGLSASKRAVCHGHFPRCQNRLRPQGAIPKHSATGGQHAR